MTTPAVLSEAMALLSGGFSVLPLTPQGKEPLVNWKEFQTRRATEQEVRAWWEKWPDANLGIVTGKISGVIVVDIDTTRGGCLEDTLALGPTEKVVKTGKGYHLHYRYPDEGSVSNRVGDDGVDVRGDGGVVVMPPSLHASGVNYTYHKRGKLGPTPPWVMDLEREFQGAGDSWIASLITQGIEKGKRNDSCSRLAGYLYAKRIPQDIAISMLSVWDSRNRPPLGNRTIRATVESVYRTAQRRTLTPQPPGTTSSVVVEKEGGVITASAKDKAYIVDLYDEEDPDARTHDISVMTYDAYCSMYASREDSWLVDGWFPDNTIAFLVAPPGSYKTWIALDLAVSVSGGTPFLGKYPVRKAGPVVLIQQEDRPAKLIERINVIHFQRVFGDEDVLLEEGPDHSFLINAGLPTLPLYPHPYRAFSFTDMKSLRGLEDLIETINPSVVIIDPLYVAGEVEDYMAKTASRMKSLKALRDVYGTSFVVVHHTRKQNKEKGKEEDNHDRELLWGSQFLNAALETGWQMRKTETDNTVSLLRHFKDQENPGLVYLTWNVERKNEQRTTYHVDITEDQPAPTDEKLLPIIERAPISSRDLAKETGMSRSTIGRRLKKLVDNGLIEKNSAGLYTPTNIIGL